MYRSNCYLWVYSGLDICFNLVTAPSIVVTSWDLRELEREINHDVNLWNQHVIKRKKDENNLIVL
jgi:hypothetical protein